MAMEGRMMPAGMSRPNVMDERKKPRMAAERSRMMVEAMPPELFLQRPKGSVGVAEHSAKRE
jgi:hypothetical protein